MSKGLTALLVVIATIGLGGCGGGQRASKAAGGPTGARSIPMVVVRHGFDVVPYVQVEIAGHRYAFVVDTGAARTVIRTEIADTLRLPLRGRRVVARTIGCDTLGRPVQVTDWRVGGVSLPPTLIYATHVRTAARRVNGLDVAGLFGSDVLARFGRVTFEFQQRRLILAASPPTTGDSIPMQVRRDLRGGVFEIVRLAVRGRLLDFQVDTGAGYTLILGSTSEQLRLAQIAPRVTGHGAAGCAFSATPVAVRHWTAGHAKLPSALAFSLDAQNIRRIAGVVIDGVLGPDVLSTFRRVTLDFIARRLTLAVPKFPNPN